MMGINNETSPPTVARHVPYWVIIGSHEEKCTSTQSLSVAPLTTNVTQSVTTRIDI